MNESKFREKPSSVAGLLFAESRWGLVGKRIPSQARFLN